MSSCYQSCEVLLTKKHLCTNNFRILFIGIRGVSLGSLLPRRTLRGLLGSHVTVISILGERGGSGRANGRITRSWKGPESFRSLHNMLLMSASPTSSQLNVNNIISSQTPLCKALISFLGIIPLSAVYLIR